MIFDKISKNSISLSKGVFERGIYYEEDFKCDSMYFNDAFNVFLFSGSIYKPTYIYK